MNSRDAMYEEQVKAALEASRTGEGAAESGNDEALDDTEPTEEMAEDKGMRKGKRKREEDDAGEFTDCQIGRSNGRL
jgi:hypothetical protein